MQGAIGPIENSSAAYDKDYPVHQGNVCLMRRVRERPFVLEHLAEITAIAGRATQIDETGF
jgi:hypothetical protein